MSRKHNISEKLLETKKNKIEERITKMKGRKSIIEDHRRKAEEKIADNGLITDEKAIRTFRVRSRFTLSFFSIIFPILIVSIGVSYFLSINGIPLYKQTSPVTVTLSIAFFYLILGYAISFFLMNTVFDPLEELNDATKEVAAGNYDVQLNYTGSIEEIQNTIENFNFMTQELSSVEIMRNDFIANVSHEFKTPLSSITGYVTLLQDPDLTAEEKQEYMQLIFFNIEKLNDLTGNILQLSKLENQQTLPKPVTYRLDEQLREAIVLLESKWSKKNIALDIDMDNVTYTGQQSFLLQVWTNLIGNAIKFSNQDDEISIRLKKEDSTVIVSVEDHGIGMDEKTVQHVFEKFYQGDSSRKEQGNGLGLAVCKEIVQKCGGQIQVVSREGEGSVFTVTLSL